MTDDCKAGDRILRQIRSACSLPRDGCWLTCSQTWRISLTGTPCFRTTLRKTLSWFLGMRSDCDIRCSFPHKLLRFFGDGFLDATCSHDRNWDRMPLHYTGIISSLKRSLRKQRNYAVLAAFGSPF